MTFAEDFLEEKGLEEDYPSVFGITFTPTITGIVLAVLGIVGAAYMYMNMVKPTQAKYQQLETKKEQVQAQLNQIKRGDLQKLLAQRQADLKAQKALKSRVVAMFTNEKDLDTLLIDLNNFVAANNGELLKYQPDSSISTITNNSLGPNTEGKLKRKGISISFEANFAQTKKIISDLEKLQPLLMVKSISSKVSEEPTAILTSSQSQIVPRQTAVLNTEIKLDAILPLSQAELEKAREAEQTATNEGNKTNRRKNSKK